MNKPNLVICNLKKYDCNHFKHFKRHKSAEINRVFSGLLNVLGQKLLRVEKRISAEYHSHKPKTFVFIDFNYYQSTTIWTRKTKHLTFQMHKVLCCCTTYIGRVHASLFNYLYKCININRSCSKAYAFSFFHCFDFFLFFSLSFNRNEPEQ